MSGDTIVLLFFAFIAYGVLRSRRRQKHGA